MMGLEDAVPITSHSHLEDAPPLLFEGRLYYVNQPPAQNTQLHSIIKQHRREHNLRHLEKLEVSGGLLSHNKVKIWALVLIIEW